MNRYRFRPDADDVSLSFGLRSRLTRRGETLAGLLGDRFFVGNGARGGGCKTLPGGRGAPSPFDPGGPP